VLAACGGDDADDASSSTTTGPPASSTTATTAQPQGQPFDLFLLPAEADDCSAVVPVPGTADREGSLDDALAQLLAGPTAEEEAQGLRSWFSDATRDMLNGVAIEGGTAEIDFDDFSQLIPNASSSCGSASLLAQLDRTVLQFEGVDRAVYSFGGDRAAFYEWLQLSAPE
jgi:spore germination protein GerM